MPTTAPDCFLFDNGSFRAASTLSLRRLARALGPALGSEVRVRPVSLLHSTNVDPKELGGRPAELLEPSLVAAARQGLRRAVLLPLFFGPSAALTEYIPERLAAVRVRHPELAWVLARPLVDLTAAPDDTRIAALLADQVRLLSRRAGLTGRPVVLVDHGSPQPGVSAVRDHLGRQLATLLGDEVAGVRVSSMERREGDAFAHADPLLATVLRDPTVPAGPVVLAMQFLQPGRHAGPGGDIAEICAAAEADRPGLRVHPTALLGQHPGLVPLLAERYREAAAQLPPAVP